MRELDHQVEFWRSFLEIAPAGVAIFDREMRYLEVSNRWIDEFRLSGRDVIGRCHYDVFPEIPARWRAIHRRCLQGAVEWSDADCLLRADGRVDWMRWEVRPWHDRAGAIGGIVIFSEDISEQKRVEATLRASEDRFRSIFGAISDGIVIASLAGEVIEVDDFGRAMFGYGPGGLTGLDFAALSSGEPPYTAAEIARRIAAACSIDRPQLFNWRCKAKDGRLFWSEISLRAIRIGGTEVVVAVSAGWSSATSGVWAISLLEATNAAEALEILERQPVDLVFTEVVMPGGTAGTERAQRVMERWPATKVVLTSGYAETGIAERSAPILNSLRLPTKPYRQANLAQTLHDTLHPG